MKRPAGLIHVILSLVCIIIFCLSLFELIYQVTPVKKVFTENAPITLKEEYVPELNYINSVSKLEAHTDSLYAEEAGGLSTKRNLYPLILNDIVRKRFYHGLYRYSIGNNFVAYLFTKLSGRSWNEVWMADDILKSTYAFCGQQALVEMNLLIKKGFPVRAVRMYSPSYNDGHFAFEVFYDNDWHFFDPDMEPNASLLLQIGRPSVASLTSLIRTDKDILSVIYPHAPANKIFELFQNYKTGEENELMPARSYLFASVTKIISYAGWLLSLIVYLLYLRRYSFSFSRVVEFNKFRSEDKQPLPVI
ncbi:MAG: hypothetical protein ACRDEB_00775 [Chitinophagaceae bacterium]